MKEPENEVTKQSTPKELFGRLVFKPALGGAHLSVYHLKQGVHFPVGKVAGA
jgi:hypothetical protein